MGTRRTAAVCPECRAEVPAVLLERDGDIYLSRNCGRHGESEVFFWKDAKVYLECLPSHDDVGLLPPDPLDVFDPRVSEFLTTFAVDVTVRCNLACPNCISAADHPGGGQSEDPSLDQILAMIPDWRGRPTHPNISLVGGESTLRKDLPEIVAAIIRDKGLVPRLNTNGILLEDDGLIERLHGAGLRWVILQFDGFASRASLEFRGRDLVDMKLRVIDKLAARGFNIHFAVMVQKGVNDGELGPILRFAASHPNVRRVSFYPRSHMGRIEDARESSTHVADVMKSIEDGLNGEISREDILAAKRLGQKIFRLTGNPMFRPRPCIYPFLIMRKGERLVSCHKFFNLLGALSDPAALMKFLMNGRRLLSPDEGRFPADFLFVNIEKFYDAHAFDARGARNCHHIYLTPSGAHPFCVYNTIVRGKAYM